MRRRCSRPVVAAITLFASCTAGAMAPAAVVHDLPPLPQHRAAGSSTAAPRAADPDLPTESPKKASRVVRAAALTPAAADHHVIAQQISDAPSADEPQVRVRTALDPQEQVGGDLQFGPVPQPVEVLPVPEPSTGLLLAAGMLAALARRGSRQSRR